MGEVYFENLGYVSVFDKLASEIKVGDRDFEVCYDQMSREIPNIYDVLADDYKSGEGSSPVATLYVEGTAHFESGDVILVPGIMGYESDGVTISANDLMLNVIGYIDTQQTIAVIAINGMTIDGTQFFCPEMPSDATLIKIAKRNFLGRDMYASSVENINTTVDDSIPEISAGSRNYCQDFLEGIDVDRSIIKQYNQLYGNYSFEDSIRTVRSKMKYLRDLSFMLGDYSQIFKTTEGVWHQAKYTFRYSDDLDNDQFLELTRKVGTNSPYKNYTIICGGALERMFNVLIGTNTKMSNSYGTFKFVYSPIFDSWGGECGLCIPDGELVKYTYMPYTESYSEDGLKYQIRECSALGFKHPYYATRIIQR